MLYLGPNSSLSVSRSTLAPNVTLGGKGLKNGNDGALEIVDSRQQGNNMWCLVCWLGRSGALACLDFLAGTGLTSSRHAFLLFSLKMKETIEQLS